MLILGGLTLSHNNIIAGGVTEILNIAANGLHSDSEFIGDSANRGWGLVNQSGGTNTVDSDLKLGMNTGNIGTYNISSAASLKVTSTLWVGVLGTGSYNQSGGTATVAQMLVGPDLGSVGTCNLTGGTLSVSGTCTLGNVGSGTFNCSGGLFNPAVLLLGDNASGNSTFNLSSVGTLSSTFELIGTAGSAAFNQTGGTNSPINIQISGASSPVYTLSGGLLQANTLAVGGGFGSGQFVHSGGTASLQTLNIAADGTYTLSGNGSLTIHSDENIGAGGSGTFIQNGGNQVILATGNGLVVGGFNSSTGTFLLNAGQLQVSAGANSVGYASNGIFTQTGGINTLIGAGTSLTLGYFPGSSGTYSLSGTVSMLLTGNETIGLEGDGTFVQSGGTHTITGYFALGQNPGSRGTFILSGGILMPSPSSTSGIAEPDSSSRLAAPILSAAQVYCTFPSLNH